MKTKAILFVEFKTFNREPPCINFIVQIRSDHNIVATIDMQLQLKIDTFEREKRQSMMPITYDSLLIQFFLFHNLANVIVLLAMVQTFKVVLSLRHTQIVDAVVLFLWNKH